MNSKILGTTAIAALAIGFSGVATAGPSAKFAADWAANSATLAEIVAANTGSSDSSTDAEIVAAELMATIKVPQNKELLIGVSGEARLLTVTVAKGKNNGGPESSTAEADLNLEVRLAPSGTPDVCVDGTGELAVPGAITFASRHQTLSVDVAGFADAVSGTPGTVEVGLSLDTVAAHHFQFLGVDMDSGEYDVWACFSGEALTSVSDLDGSAAAFVAIQKRIVTVQEVRAVKDAILDLQ